MNELTRKQILETAYDCTGQAFTAWYRIVKMQGRFFAYHDVAYDV